MEPGNSGIVELTYLPCVAFVWMIVTERNELLSCSSHCYFGTLLQQLNLYSNKYSLFTGGKIILIIPGEWL